VRGRPSAEIVRPPVPATVLDKLPRTQCRRANLFRLARLFALSVLAFALVPLSSAAGARSTLHFHIFARTGIRLTDVVSTGHGFLYVANTTNKISTAGPTGTPAHPLASLPHMSEETRCVVSSGGHGFPAHAVYCHTPDNKIYRLSADGKSLTVFATLPNHSQSDGALTFDTVGRFGYRLVAATGRSGHSKPAGGVVYAIGATGSVDRIGTYPGPGGSDEIAIAPRSFGSTAGSALVAPDPGAHSGTIVSVSPHGHTSVLATLPTGPNPIAVIPVNANHNQRGGVFVADTSTRNVYFASAAQLAAYRGDVLVGGELNAHFWILHMHNNRLVILELATDLPAAKYNLEGATYVSR
jgi:hypothetical protein